MNNLWGRQQNKRALEKKARAKQRTSLGTQQNVSEEDANPRQTGVVVGVLKTFIEIRLLNTDLVYQADVRNFSQIVVGDHVSFSVDEENKAKIIERLERRSVITRMRGDVMRRGAQNFTEHDLAANVDIGVIVASSAQPDFKPHFVDRFLIALEMGSVQPLICITKSDLASKLAEEEALYAGLDIPIIEVSTKTGNGIESLKKLLKGKVAVFVGQSGVGKSSLIQTLTTETEIRVQEVNEKTGTGKHTTTSSKMYEWSPDSFIIDTPGIRTFNTESIPKNQLRFFFHDFDDAATRCRFKDCLHDHEPRCTVMEDVALLKIKAARYASYIRLLHDA